MNIYPFINSRDIRVYLKSVDYSFSSLEAAWLIWKSKYTSVREKHAAWKELMESMPDCKIEERASTRPYPSLHRLLERLMEVENKYIALIQADDPKTFFCFEYTSDSVWQEGYSLPCYAECLKRAIACCRNESETEAVRIRIRKVWFDGSGRSIDAEVSAGGEIMKVLCDELLTQEEWNILHRSFDGMRFDFPTPFKRGDIICNPGRLSSTDCECDYGLCVLEAIPCGSNRGDSSDMVVQGLFQRDDGVLFAECTANYMNFEHYRGALTGKKRVLTAISNYIRNEISLELLLNAYHAILAEEQAISSRPWNTTREGLELAGILGGDCCEQQI